MCVECSLNQQGAVCSESCHAPVLDITPRIFCHCILELSFATTICARTWLCLWAWERARFHSAARHCSLPYRYARRELVTPCPARPALYGRSPQSPSRFLAFAFGPRTLTFLHPCYLPTRCHDEPTQLQLAQQRILHVTQSKFGFRKYNSGGRGGCMWLPTPLNPSSGTPWFAPGALGVNAPRAGHVGRSHPARRGYN